MLGRKRRHQQQQQQVRGPSGDAQSIQGAASLIGGSGVSLDGQSLILPDDSRYVEGDDMSSIATSNYGGRGQSFGAAGVAAEEPAVPPVPFDAATGVPAEEAAEEVGSESKYGAGRAGGCCTMPLWLRDSPSWLKAIIVLSVALLVGATILVGVAAGINGNENSSNNNSAGSVTETTPTETTAAPTPAPAPALSSSPAPTMSPTESMKPTIMPFPGQTQAPTTSPSLSPTVAPTLEESESPTEDPGPSTTVITFYVTAGRFQEDGSTVLEDGLPQLPTDNDNAFMVHLGDWNSPFATNCDSNSYTVVNTLYSTSAVPVYFIPGDNEYNDCPNPEEALDLWYDNLLGYETEYWPAGPFTVMRQDQDYPENFAFLHENILFVGINLVGGTIHDQDEWDARQAADLEWIDNNFEENKNQTDLLVVFAHADPDIQSTEPFYTPFIQRVNSTYAIPTILIHRNLGIETSGFEPNYAGVDGLIVLVVEGSIWPPMKIELNAAGLFTFDQSTWFSDGVNRKP
jgi:hypothetical protein